MIIRGATLISRLAFLFAVLFNLAACGGGGGGASFYDPDNNFPPLTITTTGLPNAIAGIQYNALLVADGGDESYSWSLLNDGGTGFTINNGGILSGIAPASGSYGLTIQVRSAGQSATTSFILTVTGSDSPSPLAIATTTLPDASPGADYNALLEASGGQGSYQWTLLNDGGSGLQLSPDGLLSGTGPAGGQYALTVAVQDNTSTVSSTLILVSATTADSLTIKTTSLPNGIVNQSYAAVLNASGGNVPYVWTLVSDGGSGLNLSTAGVLSGVPRRPGTFGLVFSVSDGSSTDQSALTLTIAQDDSAVVLNIVTETLPPADGVLYAAIVQAIGGKAPYTWSGDDTSDPGTGFEVDAASGSITGNTTGLLPGEYGYSITVEDSAGGTDVRSYIIEVLGGTGDLQPVTILTANPLPDATQELPDATEGMTYSVVMRTIGGTGSNNTWEVLETIKDDGTAVPAGDGPSFEPPGGSAESGVLFWSAAKITAGNYLVTVRVSSNGADRSADTVTFNLQAVPAP